MVVPRDAERIAVSGAVEFDNVALPRQSDRAQGTDVCVGQWH